MLLPAYRDNNGCLVIFPAGALLGQLCFVARICSPHAHNGAEICTRVFPQRWFKSCCSPASLYSHASGPLAYPASPGLQSNGYICQATIHSSHQRSRGNSAGLRGQYITHRAFLHTQSASLRSEMPVLIFTILLGMQPPPCTHVVMQTHTTLYTAYRKTSLRSAHSSQLSRNIRDSPRYFTLNRKLTIVCSGRVQSGLLKLIFISSDCQNTSGKLKSSCAQLMVL